ncbi:MFS transporter, partial [bacterium]|nr:MFS transporter [bacterium]
YAFVAGNALSIGLIGAITAGPPLRFLIDIFNWRSVIFVTGLLTLVLGFVIWLIVRDQPREKGYIGFTDSLPQTKALTFKGVWKNLFKVLKYRNTLLLFIIPGGIVGCILTFSGLWGVPYLVSHHQLTPNRASALTSCLLIGWAMGGPVFGWLSDRLGRRKPIYIVGSMVSTLGWSFILFMESLSFYPLAAILWVTGFFSGCMIIGFAFAMESVPRSLSGTVSGLTNMGVMMGPMLLQPIVGKILDHYWTGELINGVRLYSLEAYEYGFIPMMGWAVLSTIILFFTIETNCKNMVE